MIRTLRRTLLLSLIPIALGGLWSLPRPACACIEPPPPEECTWWFTPAANFSACKITHSTLGDITGLTVNLPYDSAKTTWSAYGIQASGSVSGDLDTLYWYDDPWDCYPDYSWQHAGQGVISGTPQPGSNTVTAYWDDDEQPPFDPPYDDGWDSISADESGSKSVTVKLVRVDKVQTQNDGTWEDVSGTVYVLKGTTANFKAIKNPSGASWPSGKPVWGGSSGASGTGETKSVTFNTVSSSSTNYKTVTCECGNTITVNVIVFELTGILTPEDDFSGRSQSTYGLEEIVYLSYTANPPGISPPLVWQKVSGVGSLNAAKTEYYAGPSDGGVSLKLELTAGPSKGQGPTYNRSVVKPTSTRMELASQTPWHEQYSCTVGICLYYYLEPKYVSFCYLEFAEGTCPATDDWGIFTGMYDHPPCDFGTIGWGDITLGCRVVAPDYADLEYRCGWWEWDDGGGSTWNIPSQYVIGANYYNFWCQDQTGSVDDYGESTMEKGGCTKSAEYDEDDSQYTMG